MCVSGPVSESDQEFITLTSRDLFFLRTTTGYQLRMEGGMEGVY